MKRLVLVAVALAVLGAAGPAAAAGRLTVTTSLSPRWLFFADSVTAHVDVLFDPRRVDAHSLRLETSFAPWEETGETRVSTAVGGSIGHRSWRFTIACLSLDCLPRGTGVERFRLPAVTLRAQTRDGSTVVVRRAWSSLKIAGRFLPSQTVGLRPVFRLNTGVPAATYRVDPSSLALVLDVVGALVVALAAGFGAAEVVRWRAQTRTVAAVPPLVRALELLRQAEQRDPEDRRRAASLLARTLTRTGNGLASAATEVAWSPHEPAPSRLEELAQAVEAELEKPA